MEKRSLFHVCCIIIINNNLSLHWQYPPWLGKNLVMMKTIEKVKHSSYKLLQFWFVLVIFIQFLNLLSVPVTRIIHMHYPYTCFYNSISYEQFVFISQIYCFDLLLFHGLFHILKEMKICLYFIRTIVQIWGGSSRVYALLSIILKSVYWFLLSSKCWQVFDRESLYINQIYNHTV